MKHLHGTVKHAEHSHVKNDHQGLIQEVKHGKAFGENE